MGVIQDLTAPVTVHTLAGAQQSLPTGAIGSQEAIKDLGTNGGGPFNANSAHPFENPTGFTNLFEIWLLLLIPFSLPWTFGKLCKDRRQGLAVLGAMAVLWIVPALLVMGLEAGGNASLPEGRQPDRLIHGRRRQSDRQGSAVRRGHVGAVRLLGDGDLDRLGRFHARQLHAPRRRRRAHQHDVRRGLARRDRFRALRDADPRHAVGVSRRAHGRADTGVPGQEDPGR